MQVKLPEHKINEHLSRTQDLNKDTDGSNVGLETDSRFDFMQLGLADQLFIVCCNNFLWHYHGDISSHRIQT